MYLKTYNRKEDEAKNFVNSFYKKSPNPYFYVFALWSNKALVGAVGKKTSVEQVELMNTIISDKNAPGTLVGAANYNEKMHYFFSSDFQKANSYSDAVGNIKEWQFAGPFENLSQSGFYKDYGLLEYAEPTAVFKSISNADVKWFTHEIESKRMITRTFSDARDQQISTGNYATFKAFFIKIVKAEQKFIAYK